MKSVFTSFLILLSFAAFADPDSTGVVDVKTDVEPAEISWDINDSLYHIPAYDLYCGFDRKKIWGVKVDQTKKKDTTHLHVLHDSCDFHSPRVGRLTSDYGWRGSRPHYGVDIKLNTGDSIKTAFDGVVRISRYSSTYGHVIVVRHANGLETLYAHLSKRVAKEGDEVYSGSILGLGGNTGRSFGSHLHFETRYLGEPINPNDIFDITDSTFQVKGNSIEISSENFAFLKEVRKIKYHRVRSGDSLWKISRRYGVSINKLCQLNRISRKKTLRIGQRIRYN